MKEKRERECERKREGGGEEVQAVLNRKWQEKFMIGQIMIMRRYLQLMGEEFYILFSVRF